MTSLYFVRHAQPDDKWEDDRTRPLTPLGMNDRLEVSKLLSDIHRNKSACRNKSTCFIDAFVSSPYKRSFDTISDCAEIFGMEIVTDERLRERKQGKNSGAVLEKRWSNFDFCEEGGECLRSVQERNIEAVNDILKLYANKNIVIGTHGTALSTIMNYYDSSLGCDWFKKIWLCMPYVIRLDFDCSILIQSEELLSIKRGY